MNVCHVISVFLLNSMNYTFGKNIEYLWRTSKNHLVHNACVKILHISKKELSTAALCAATLPAAITVFHCNRAAGCSHPLAAAAVTHTPLRCTLLHARHIRYPLPHARWLPAIHCNCAPVRRCLRLHQRTLLAAAPTLPLLHTAARTPLAPLLPSPLPPLLLLVPRPLIAKKR